MGALHQEMCHADEPSPVPEGAVAAGVYGPLRNRGAVRAGFEYRALARRFRLPGLRRDALAHLVPARRPPVLAAAGHGAGRVRPAAQRPRRGRRRQSRRGTQRWQGRPRHAEHGGLRRGGADHRRRLRAPRLPVGSAIHQGGDEGVDRLQHGLAADRRLRRPGLLHRGRLEPRWAPSTTARSPVAARPACSTRNSAPSTRSSAM